MKGVRIILLLVSVLLCFSLNSTSAKRYMTSVHTASSFSMQRLHFGKMKVSFFKVGQGDATLIILPNGQTMLIDGGPYEAGEVIIQKLVEKGINHLDVVVGTHPDMDHIGGLIPIIEQMPVSLVLDSGKTYSSFTYHTYRNNVKKRGIPFVRVKQGQYIPLDPQVSIQVLNNGKSKDENNESSIILKVRYNKADFLLMGDADIQTEKKIIKQYDVHADVLKVGHHGSYTSTSEELLEKANPQFAILSYDKNNPYGHPHQSVVKRLKRHGVMIYTTDKQTVEIETDGEHLVMWSNLPLPLLR
ncbi:MULTISPECIES: ComEC/Rec2 family competence protein [Bacillus cereus group]|uniref:MBL fold metallo-hydrolase n=1 Tax=Bacillus cereus TaxID=1396 RepID=A0AA44Q989_BACCE|nr:MULTISPECIES: MBL fold metallo-hydrolase [Bacillus cereus group]EEL49522.1 Metallo-beta-lactamase [Bacillus cereus Rock3-44]PFA24149.1 MBL fold metallo-hydrolase [Bacillus cereus]PFN09587.1 MBL fold metallo-hydrolase [Bacillus cereus]PFO81495.1 MBL fold metallo-hydrolase [Bacillus cereus]PFR25412.1 MBL fold metallo-hydrolase [Bacillus cereus]